MDPSSCFSARLERPVKDPIPYSRQALRQDLTRVRNAWADCQASRDRNAIYGYLTAVFDLVTWWAAVDRAVSRAHWALRLCRLDLPSDEPFAAVILCTADRQKVDKRTRSKWSRVLRYAMEYKTSGEPLAPSFSGRAASTGVLRGLRDAWAWRSQVRRAFLERNEHRGAAPSSGWRGAARGRGRLGQGTMSMTVTGKKSMGLEMPHVCGY